MKTAYYGFKVGQTCKTLVSYKGDNKETIPENTKFVIIGFPCKVCKRDKTDKNKKGFLHDYFVYGHTVKNKNAIVRLNLNQIERA